MSELTLQATEPWAPHPQAAPRTERDNDRLVIAANGTRTLSGGWQMRWTGVAPGQCYRMMVEVAHQDVACPRDALLCIAVWGAPPAGEAGPKGVWDYLLPEYLPDGRVRFARTLVAPEGADCLTIRCTLRWTAAGRTVWSLPQIEAVDAPPRRRPVEVCVVTGHAHARAQVPKTVEGNTAFYAGLCEAACQGNPDLIVLPEVCLQWGVPGHAVERALPAPGPETEVFARIAREHRVRICLPILERDGDAVHNSALLIGPGGEIDGRYRKVHLAVGGEAESGILPGDGFPVFETEVGRMGCNICMDTSAAESSRMVGLNGADFLLMPIMGDHRADRFTRGSPIFNEGRWLAIMRTHAIDNQFCFVIARNNAQGSCIIDRKGEILAWNEGDQDAIQAAVDLDAGFRTWNGGCFAEVNWMQRRPHLYGAFVDPGNVGSLR